MTASKELLKRTYTTQLSALSGIEDKKECEWIVGAPVLAACNWQGWGVRACH